MFVGVHRSTLFLVVKGPMETSLSDFLKLQQVAKDIISAGDLKQRPEFMVLLGLCEKELSPSVSIANIICTRAW